MRRVGYLYLINLCALRPIFPSVIMDETTLQEADCLERHLGLKFTPDLKWNSYILSVAKDVGKMVGSFFRRRKFLTPAAVHYLYKSQIRPKMEYCSALTFGPAHPKPLFPVWIRCNVDCVGSLVTSCSSPYSLFLIDAMLQVFLCSIDIIVANARRSLKHLSLLSRCL